jgi:hypothetical protein
MQRRHHIRIAVQCLAMLGVSYGAVAQQPAPAVPGGGRQGGAAPARASRPPLFFREEWKQVPGGGEHPITADAVASANLELKLYGTSSKEIQLTGSAQDDNNPIHLWTGLCTTPCAAALKDKNSYVDLTGLGRIRWVTKTSGFHQVRPIVKLADGTWLVGDRADGSPVDWLMNDIALSEVRWLKLDVAGVVTKGNFVEKPDLSKVDEVGFADLLPGSGHGAGGWSDVAVIEVYGKPVKRQ